MSARAQDSPLPKKKMQITTFAAAVLAAASVVSADALTILVRRTSYRQAPNPQPPTYLNFLGRRRLLFANMLQQRQEVTTFVQRSNAIWHSNNGQRHQTQANEGCWSNPV